MKSLYSRDSEDQMPTSVSLEKPATSLASLALTPELKSLADLVLAQWSREDVIKRLAKHGIHPIRKVLMYGPPGNGKTTACGWLAAKLGIPLYRIRCESLIDSYIGASSKNVRETMDWISNAGKCIVLFDEIETIFVSRQKSDGGEVGRELASAMSILWQMLDRWDSPQIFCFATNMKEMLDPALVSRFELQVEFNAPTQEHVDAVLDYWSEVFHDLGGSTLKTNLAALNHTSFRQLWQRISDHVRDAALSSPQKSNA